MEPWIPVTIAAAFFQNLRFMLQKHLKATALSTAGATFARFVYAAPALGLILIGVAALQETPLPRPGAAFWPYAIVGGVAQIAATMCVVALFTHRNFAVGITFKKTEVLMAVIVGVIVLGEGVSTLGFVAILLGLVGVLILSDPPEGGGTWHRRILNRAAGLGLASGILFAISGVSYRGASLSLGEGQAVLRALVTLFCVTTFQSLAMALWLRVREPGEVQRVLIHWRVAGLVGLFSLLGSAAWFIAFTLQTVAYVKALGQIELVFSILASTLWFRERITAREGWGVALLTLSILLLILAL